MKVLGLDVSSVCTGYCVVVDGYLDKHSIGIIAIDSDKPLGLKLVVLEEALIKIIKKYQPDEVMVEDVFKGFNVKTLKTLCMCRGIVFKVCYELLNKEPITIMPTEARKIVGVVGVQKEDAYKFVVKKYKLKYDFETDNDKTDAIVLALSYDQLYKRQPKKTKKRRKRRKN